jgi:hypothetical protein
MSGIGDWSSVGALKDEDGWRALGSRRMSTGVKFARVFLFRGIVKNYNILIT